MHEGGEKLRDYVAKKVLIVVLCKPIKKLIEIVEILQSIRKLKISTETKAIFFFIPRKLSMVGFHSGGIMS